MTEEEINLIRYYVGKTIFNQKNPKKSMAFFQREGIDKNSYFSSLMIRYYGALKNDEKVEEYYLKMMEDPSSVKPSKAFTLVINSFKNMKKYDEALKAYQILENLNVKKGLKNIKNKIKKKKNIK